MSWLAEKFTELRDWVGKVVGGISDALAAGDIALPPRDPVAVAEGHLAAGRRGAQQGVAGAKEFFVSTAYSMWYGALAAAGDRLPRLEVAWIETTAFLSKTWTNFATGFQMIWEEASSWVAKRMLEIQGLFDDGLDVEAAKKAVDQQLESRLVELENAAQQSVTARDKEREASARRRRDARGDAGGHRQDFENAGSPAQDTAAGLAESQAARRRKAEARRRDRGGPQKREAADAEKGRSATAGSAGRLRGASVRPRCGHRQGHQRHRTFSSAPSPVWARAATPPSTASATEQTARNTKRLLDASVDNGLRFA